MIPAYNRAAYTREALESVLAQDAGVERMQIEVVDDCSTDEVEEVVAALGQGRVDFFRQAENVGSARNFSTCLRRARGELVHLLHSDDGVLPGFYETLGRPFETRPELGAAFCRYRVLDADGNRLHLGELEQEQPGILDGWLSRIALGQRLQTPCMVVRRSVYEQLGGFDERVKYCEDWEMWVRIAARYPVWYEPEALALYRVHTVSISGSNRRTGVDVADLRRGIELNRQHLPREEQAALTKRALEIAAITALRRGARALGLGDTATARAQTREALRTARSAKVAWYLLRYGLRGLRYWGAHELRRLLGPRHDTTTPG